MFNRVDFFDMLFEDKIFKVEEKTLKSSKIGALEIFWLYGITHCTVVSSHQTLKLLCLITKCDILIGFLKSGNTYGVYTQ